MRGVIKACVILPCQLPQGVASPHRACYTITMEHGEHPWKFVFKGGKGASKSEAIGMTPRFRCWKAHWVGVYHRAVMDSYERLRPKVSTLESKMMFAAYVRKSELPPRCPIGPYRQTCVQDFTPRIPSLRRVQQGWCFLKAATGWRRRIGD